MIPVRIVATEEEIGVIADYTAKFYDQLAVMFYRVSDCVVIKHYERPRAKIPVKHLPTRPRGV